MLRRAAEALGELFHLLRSGSNRCHIIPNLNRAAAWRVHEIMHQAPRRGILLRVEPHPFGQGDNIAQGTANISGDFIARNSLLGVSSGFVRTPSPGADGAWGTDDDDYGDMHLTANSIAINLGDDVLAMDADELIAKGILNIEVFT